MLIYCDMDEVLSDFIGGACKAHGITREELKNSRPDNSWWSMQEIMNLTEKDFWKPIKTTKHFWLDLEPTPWFCSVVDWLNKRKCNGHKVRIATSMGCDPRALTDKALWLQKYWVGFSISDLVILKDKWMMATPNRVLIDDNITNCEMFSGRGGHSILFPNEGNCNSNMATPNPPYVIADFLDSRFSKVTNVTR